MVTLAFVAAALFTALYVVAVGSADGRRIDEQLRGTELDLNDHVAGLAARILNGFDIGFVLAATPALLLVAFVRCGVRTTLALALALAGAVASARLLKSLLASADPLGGELARSVGSGFYPSGHATTVMALVLAVVVLAPATRARQLTIFLGGGVAAAVGVAHIVLDSHLPSDVVAGYLLAGGWMAAATAVVAVAREPITCGRFVRVSLATLGLCLVIAGVCAIASSGARSMPLLGAGAVATTAICLVAALATALGEADRSDSPRAGAQPAAPRR